MEFRMLFEHVHDTLAAIREPWFMGRDLGDKYAIRLKTVFDRRIDRQIVDNALSLGFYLVHSESNKRQRAGVRAVMLAEFLLKNQPTGLRDEFAKRYKSYDLAWLKQQFVNLFPSFVDDGNRASWAPDNFTDPATVAVFNTKQDWTRRVVPTYMFFVHSVRYPSAWIEDPIAVMKTWTAISTGVMTDQNPRAYTSHGLILSVPANNVLSTSPTDQWFDNYAGTQNAVKVSFEGQTMSQHIAEKSIRLGTLLTPQRVADLTGKQAALPFMAGTGQTKHNEVVITGLGGQPLPYGTTGAISLRAYFMQTKMDGTFPDRYARSQGVPTTIEEDLKKYARARNVPLLYLPTADANMTSLT
jgi:hypothetical protein